jgi:hypothetical protein
VGNFSVVRVSSGICHEASRIISNLKLLGFLQLVGIEMQNDSTSGFKCRGLMFEKDFYLEE